MENDNHNHQHANGSGFLLGVIVGVLITLLFTTKRGRIIFKEILEKGVEKFSNLEELMKESSMLDEEDIDEAEGEDFIPSVPTTQPALPEKKVVEQTQEEKIEPKQAKESTTSKQEEETAPATPPKEEKMPEAESNSEKKSTTKEENPSQPKASTKPKSANRWFRGIRKKS